MESGQSLTPKEDHGPSAEEGSAEGAKDQPQVMDALSILRQRRKSRTSINPFLLKHVARTLTEVTKERKHNDLLSDRVLYARKAGEEIGEARPESGEKITVDVASALKDICWGSASMPPKNEWIKQGVVLHAPEQIFAYGVKAPRNGCRNFMMCLQAYFLKHLLFEKKGRGKDKRRRYTKQKLEAPKKPSVPAQGWSQLLKPNDKDQKEMLIGGLAEVLLKVADDHEGVLCVPGSENCFEPTAQYGIDGITEKLYLFKAKKDEEMRNIVRRFLPMITNESGVGLLCVLYSLILTRNFQRIKKDLQDQAGNSLIDAMGDCTAPLINLIIFGKATPYIHNGTMMIADENDELQERVGIEVRNDIGFLMWDKDEDRTKRYNLGSRLKTPVLPMWLTKCNDQIGVLFNPNRELMRSHHAENRFQLYYYANMEFKKEEQRKETILTIDTRHKLTKADQQHAHQQAMDLHDNDMDELTDPPLELAIRSKWDGATVDWHGFAPYIT